MSTERPFVNGAGADPRLDLSCSVTTGPASVAGRPVAKPLQFVLQRSDSRLGKGGASFGLGSRPGFGLQGLADCRVIANLLARLRVEAGQAVVAQPGLGSDPQPDSDRLQPDPSPLIWLDALVPVWCVPVDDQLQPALEVVLIEYIRYHIEGNRRPIVKVDLLPHVVLPRVQRGNLDHQERASTCGRHVEGRPVPMALDVRENGDIRAQRPDPRQVPVHATVRYHHRRGLAGQARLEHVLEVGQVAVMCVRLHDEVPRLGKEHILQGQRDLIERFLPIGLDTLDVTPAVTERIGLGTRRNMHTGGRDGTHDRRSENGAATGSESACKPYYRRVQRRSAPSAGPIFRLIEVLGAGYKTDRPRAVTAACRISLGGFWSTE